MKTVASEQVICIDIDETLVLHKKAKKKDKVVAITDPYDNAQRYLVVHQPHVKVLKDRKARGAYIIVWSQGGFAWASAVVRALGLEAQVDLVLSKPSLYIDALPVQDWMSERLYISPDSGYGKL